MELRGKKVLVTGATGFIGGRIVEQLVLECGADVRVVVRNFGRAVRVARLGVDLVPGSLEDADSIMRAAEGCDVIIHTAFGQGGSDRQNAKVTVDGTRAVAEAALACRVPRVVHFSTMSVYGGLPNGSFDETANRNGTLDAYGAAKRDAENLMLDYHASRQLQVAILQPTFVYGPFGRYWTINPLKRLIKGRVALVDGDRALCNAVYVDDVVQAAVLAATKEAAIGQRFLISADEPVSWSDFHRSYERMLGLHGRVIALTDDEIRQALRQERKENQTIAWILRKIRDRPDVRDRMLRFPPIGLPVKAAQAIRQAVSTENSQTKRNTPSAAASGAAEDDEQLPVTYPPEQNLAMFAARPRVVIDKARRLLGYQPRFDLEGGMRQTELWARWAGLVPEEVPSHRFSK